MVGDARQLVREGKVTATYPERHTARVVFEEKDGIVSPEMPVLTSCSAGNRSYSMPDVGDMVVCLMATNADMTGTGWIIGSRFNDKSKPNANSQDVTRIDFADGSFVEYNRKSHELKLKSTGKITIEADDEIAFKGNAKIKFDATGGFDVVSEAAINATGKPINLNMEG